MATVIEPIKKSSSSRTADKMLLKMVLDSDCLPDSHIKILAGLADKFWKQSQFRANLERQSTIEGPNVP